MKAKGLVLPLKSTISAMGFNMREVWLSMPTLQEIVVQYYDS